MIEYVQQDLAAAANPEQASFLHRYFKTGPATLELLVRSASLWERRIAIMATFHFIRRGSFDATLRIAEMLLTDKEELIHKRRGGC